MLPTINRCAAAVGFLLASPIPLILSTQQAEQTPGLNPPWMIRSHVNEVIVPVVVRDEHGHTVADLTRHDFQVFDDGKPQALTGFMLVKHVPGTDPVSPANGSNANSLSMSSPNQPGSPGQRFVVLLFDDLNLDNSELVSVRKAAEKAIDNSLASSDMVAVLTSSGNNSGLTRDRAVLQKALANLKSQRILQKHRDCPEESDYEADLIIQGDSGALGIATSDAKQCAGLNTGDASLDQVAAQMAAEAARRVVFASEQNLRDNYAFLRRVVSGMAALPGQRILIFVSPGFLTDTTEAMDRDSEILDVAARGNVTINALDATGVATNNSEASEKAQGPGAYRQLSLALTQGVLAELADGTGGTFVHNNNNFDAGMANLLSGPEYLYLMTFSTAGVKPNGSYHKLDVKVAKDGLSVQSRRGYFTPKEETDKK
jgi:VWFA-related protein